MRLYALLSHQGTACSETVLTDAEYAKPEMRAKVEARSCKGGQHDPVPGTWTDVSDNESCWLSGDCTNCSGAGCDECDDTGQVRFDPREAP